MTTTKSKVFVWSLYASVIRALFSFVHGLERVNQRFSSPLGYSLDVVPISNRKSFSLKLNEVLVR